MRSPTSFQVRRVSRVGGGGGDGVASVDDDAASRGLGLRYKANIFPE